MNRISFTLLLLALSAGHSNAETTQGNLTQEQFDEVVTYRDTLGDTGENEIVARIEDPPPETRDSENPLAGTDAYSDPIGVDSGLGTAPVTSVPGESIDVRTGELTLTATDLVVPGNGGMDIVVSRSRSKTYFDSRALTYGMDRATQGFIGDWELDLPYIEIGSIDAFVHRRDNNTSLFVQSPLLYNTTEFIAASNMGPDRSACITPYTPNPTPGWDHPNNPMVTINNQWQSLVALYDGLSIAGLPGGQRDLLFQSYADNARSSKGGWLSNCHHTEHLEVRRTDGGVTKAMWVLNAPDGRTYVFDEPTRGSHWKSLWSSSPLPVFGKMRVYLSKIQDANGNVLFFEYDDTLAPNVLVQENGPRLDLREHAYLKRIWSPDGREVRFEWECNPFAVGGGTSNCPEKDPNSSDPGTQAAPLYRLKRVTHENREVVYHYNDDPEPGVPGYWKSRYLENVQLPGGLSWNYRATMGTDFSTLCSFRGLVFAGRSINYQVTHPQGAVVQYAMETKKFARTKNNVTSCSVGSAVASRVVDDLVADPVSTKWCYEPYRGGDTNSQWVHVYGPTRFEAYEFSRERNNDDDDWQEGLMLSASVYPRRDPPSTCTDSIGDPGQTGRLRRTTYTYEHAAPIYMPENANDPFYRSVPFIGKAARTPKWEKLRTVSDDSVGTFQTETVSAIVYPVSPLTLIPMPKLVKQTSPLAAPRHTLIKYQGITYVRREVKSQCLVPDDSATDCPVLDGAVQGTVNDYDSLGNLIQTTEFGVPTTFVPHGHGEVFTSTDARQKTTVFQNYKAGIPQSIQYPDDEAETLVVNGKGQIDSITNALGRTTHFEYDLAGRLDRVQFPVGADLDPEWLSPTTRRTTRGPLVVETRFDGFGRRISEVSTDTATGRSIAKQWAYDAAGRTEFESYPQAALQSVRSGMEFKYDELGRLKETRRVLSGNLDGPVSTVSYRAPEFKDTFDFHNKKVTTQYRSYGAPGYDLVTKVEADYTPRNDTNGQPGTLTKMVTDFVRDDHGFAYHVVHGNVVRKYQLDKHRHMALEYAPEIGGGPPSIPGGYNISYCRNEVGQITGKSINTTCESWETAGLVGIQYDDRGRVVNESYKDDGDSPNRETYYTDTGKVRLIKKGGVENKFVYNTMADDLESETVIIDGYKFATHYQRENTLRNVASITYPSGRKYELSPDAFGRPTRISGVLGSVSYHPTGTPSLIQYVNGQNTTIELTDRQEIETMTARRGSIYAMHLGFVYDEMGNMRSVIDNRYPEWEQFFEYDELNRLVRTQYPGKLGQPSFFRAYSTSGNVLLDQMFGRVATFEYDSLRNRLTQATVNAGAGSQSRSIEYDALGNMTHRGNDYQFDYGYDGNMLSGTRFDASQNVEFSKTLIYDGSNHIVREDTEDGARYLVYSGENLLMEYLPDEDEYTEYVYLGSMLVGSRRVQNARNADSDNDGVSDIDEFRGLDPTP